MIFVCSILDKYVIFSSFIQWLDYLFFNYGIKMLKEFWNFSLNERIHLLFSYPIFKRNIIRINVEYKIISSSTCFRKQLIFYINYNTIWVIKKELMDGDISVEVAPVNLLSLLIKSWLLLVSKEKQEHLLINYSFYLLILKQDSSRLLL